MTTQPKALALELAKFIRLTFPDHNGCTLYEAADELERQHAEIERLTTLVADIHLLGIKQLKSQRDEIERLTAENAELLGALKAISPFIPVTSASEGGAAKYSENVRAADMVRAALAGAGVSGKG